MCATTRLGRSHLVDATRKDPGLEIIASEDFESRRCGRLPVGCHSKFTSDPAGQGSMRLSRQNLDRNGIFSTPIPMQYAPAHLLSSPRSANHRLTGN